MPMIRTITVVSVFFLATNSIVHAEDSDSSFLDWGYKHQHFQSADMNMSTREYEETYSRNRKFVSNNLRSYSKHKLGLIGIPEQSVDFMGAALGMVINGAKLNLNKSKTLALELKDVSDSDRTLYFGVNLDW